MSEGLIEERELPVSKITVLADFGVNDDEPILYVPKLISQCFVSCTKLIHETEAPLGMKA